MAERVLRVTGESDDLLEAQIIHGKLCLHTLELACALPPPLLPMPHCPFSAFACAHPPCLPPPPSLYACALRFLLLPVPTPPAAVEGEADSPDASSGAVASTSASLDSPFALKRHPKTASR